MTTLARPTTRFALPDDRTATEPAEQRGLRRDGVRLLVATEDDITHTTFDQLPRHLDPADLLVVNTSATIAAELDATRPGDRPLLVHVANHLDDGSWVIELRSGPNGEKPFLFADPGEVIRLPDSVAITLLDPYPRPNASPTGFGTRLWRAQIDSPVPFENYVANHGRPISYGYLRGRWPLADYQTIFATDPGSAEMASAARPFSYQLLARLIARGVGFAPITLHTGVSSQEGEEPPQAERFIVSAATAEAVNHTRRIGGRIVAVGTTVTRALESAAQPDGAVQAASGWTELTIGPHRAVRVVDGLITGWHNPDASHLLLVESVAGSALTQRAYHAAAGAGYLWHEFGDSCLLLPRKLNAGDHAITRTE